MSKYKNTRIETPDGIFDSKKEYKEWCQLKLLQKSGIISSLERQKEFQLIPTLYTSEGTIRRTSYVADFFYFDNQKNCWVSHDTKGFPTPEYKLKKKLMLWLYPNLLFVESGNTYKSYYNLHEVK